MSNQKEVSINSSRSMGNWGNRPIVSASKTFRPIDVISVIEVKEGSAIVTGKQNTENPTGDRDVPAWVAITLAVGTHIVNLTEVTVDASASTLTVCHYGG